MIANSGQSSKHSWCVFVMDGSMFYAKQMLRLLLFVWMREGNITSLHWSADVIVKYIFCLRNSFDFINFFWYSQVCNSLAHLCAKWAAGNNPEGLFLSENFWLFGSWGEWLSLCRSRASTLMADCCPFFLVSMKLSFSPKTKKMYILFHITPIKK